MLSRLIYKIHERHILTLVFLYCFASGLLVNVFQVSFLKTGATGWLVCPFHYLTGLQCPGCGMTRAFLELGEFNIITAFHYNPIAPLFFFLALAWLLIPKLRTIKLPLIVQIAIVAVALVFGILRNIVVF